MPSSPECRWTFYPPPGSSFVMHPDGVRLQFAKGREAQVEAWFRDWVSAAVKQDHAAPHGRFDFYPVWAPPPPLPNQGLSSWLFSFPPFVVCHMVSGTNMGGGIPVDVMRGAPGSLMLRFPRGQEQAVISHVNACLDVATGHTFGQFREALEAPKQSPAAAQASAIGDSFFRALGVERPHAFAWQGRVTTDGALTKLCETCGKPETAHSTQVSLPLDAAPPTPRNDVPAPPAPPAPGVAAFQGAPPTGKLPECACPPAVKGSGAHVEGCPAENIPPEMLR